MIAAMVWSFIVDVLTKFWMWFVGAAVAVLAFLFSPTIRKYTIGILAALVLLALAFIWGYNSNHNVETITHACDLFRNSLKGPTTEIDKIIAVFERKGLCE